MPLCSTISTKLTVPANARWGICRVTRTPRIAVSLITPDSTIKLNMKPRIKNNKLLPVLKAATPTPSHSPPAR